MDSIGREFRRSWNSHGVRISALAAVLIVGASGCEREEKEGVAPPPAPVAQLDPCEKVGAAPREGLPGRAAGFCIDPDSDVRRYGASAPTGLDAVCVELFNGECELYKSYGLESVKTLHYVPDSGGLETVNVVVSSFRRSDGAFGFYTRRILGDDLPSRATVKALDEIEGRAVAGIGIVYLWRGKQVVEMTLVSDVATPDEIEQKSAALLPGLAREMARTLIGPTTPERSVRLLEEPELDPLGVAVSSDEILGVAGTGSGAIGYYSRSKPPHRVFSGERRDEAGAKDLLRLLVRSGASNKLKGRDIFRVRRTREGQPPETWFLRKQRNTVLGVGPLNVLGEPQLSTPEERKREDEQWQAFAIRRLLEVSARESKLGE